MQGIKGDLKRRYIDMGLAHLRNHPMNTLYKLPPGIDYLIQKDSVYYHLQDEVKDEVLYSRQINNQDSDIDNFINEHAAKLVECVLVSPEAWMMVTQLEAYVSNKPQTDDCAFKRRAESFSIVPTAHIIDKNRFKATWKDVVIRWGNLEFLVLAGFCGKRHSNMEKAFLGHSVSSEVTSLFIGDNSNNNNKIFDVIVPVERVPYFQSTRYLRDYTKNAASKQWSYITKRFVRNNFEASHCLSIDAHQSRANKIYKDRASLGSLVIGIVARKVYTKVHPDLNRHFSKIEIF
ncbi:hypothetical protein BDC45DRAFT_507559 [Circinella umbellata]|nr:hypothetical protein BDC45DRAFT_507559 [Circinella umbellata]